VPPTIVIGGLVVVGAGYDKSMGSDPFQLIPNIKYVFLDRDGVINRKPPEGEVVRRWKEFEILPGVEQAIARLHAAGLKVIVVTNQRGIALGRMSELDLAEIHSQLMQHIAAREGAIDAIYYCPHDRDECECRKPGVGMFERALADFPEASAENSVMIGDSVSDIEAGVRLGMTTIFIKGEPSRQKPGAERAQELATFVSNSLHDAVAHHIDLLKRRHE
jgi:D-glycero-D-manno-heptose 1,7-bisphosphate phosphatase